MPSPCHELACSPPAPQPPSSVTTPSTDHPGFSSWVLPTLSRGRTAHCDRAPYTRQSDPPQLLTLAPPPLSRDWGFAHPSPAKAPHAVSTDRNPSYRHIRVHRRACATRRHLKDTMPRPLGRSNRCEPASRTARVLSVTPAPAPPCVARVVDHVAAPLVDRESKLWTSSHRRRGSSVWAVEAGDVHSATGTAQSTAAAEQPCMMALCTPPRSLVDSVHREGGGGVGTSRRDRGTMAMAQQGAYSKILLEERLY